MAVAAHDKKKQKHRPTASSAPLVRSRAARRNQPGARRQMAAHQRRSDDHGETERETAQLVNVRDRPTRQHDAGAEERHRDRNQSDLHETRGSHGYDVNYPHGRRALNRNRPITPRRSGSPPTARS
jgi:hypothetical protein